MNKPELVSRIAHTIPNGSVDVRMIAAIRCILAFSALVIVYVDPTQPAIFSALTYSSLVVYTVWSCVLAIIAFRRDPSAPPPRDTHWGDMLFCAYLVTLTHGTNSLFFTYFIFAILSASFSRGTQEGLLVTGAAVFLFVLASIWFEPDARFGFDQSLVRPIYLISLGYMISYWGGHEIMQRRRMWLFQEINSPLDQRLGYGHAITVNLERILQYYEAKACILILNRPGHQQQYLSFYVPQSQQNSGPSDDNQDPVLLNANTITEDAAKILLNLPVAYSTLHNQSPAWWKRLIPDGNKSRDTAYTAELGVLENLLDTPCFLTAPYHQQDGSTGRFFLIPQKQKLTQSDIPFVRQLLASISYVVENIQLMDELVSSSAKHERFKISLDIHDTTIQPYIGLKLGLDALSRQAGSNNPLSKDIGELLNMTDATIQDLRRYVTKLREDKALAGDSLLKSVHEQAERFKRFYGIDVKVSCDTQLHMESRLAEAAQQIFAEGLSNILKHTQAKNAYLSIHCDNQNLLLEIGNENLSLGKKAPDFTPASINARALSLGGVSFIKSDAQGYTVVYISLPI